MQAPPDFYFQSPVGDRALALVMVLHGSIAYLDEVMAVRRLWVPGSWNTLFQNEPNRQRQLDYYRRMNTLFESFNQMSGGRWATDVNRTILGQLAAIARLEARQPFLDPDCRRQLRRLAARDRLAFYRKWTRQAVHRIWKSFRSERMQNRERTVMAKQLSKDREEKSARKDGPGKGT